MSKEEHMNSMISFIRSIWAILRKDLGVWLRQSASAAVTVLPPLAFLLIEALGAVAVGRSPVALVTLDHGSKGIQMQQIFHQADVFRITDASPQQAQLLLKNLDVVAVITIPADFTRRVDAHEAAAVDVTVNNLNLDFTNDIRRSVPDAITQFYQAQGSASPIKVTLREHDLRAHDVELFEYDVLPTIILLLTISGLVSSSLAAAREWETKTVKELLLSPTARAAIIIGKVLAGFTISFALGLLVLGLGYVLGWLRPEGGYWLSTLLIIALVSLFSSGLGVAFGALVQRIQAVIVTSALTALYLFFLSGGITVLAFEPIWLQNIAAFVPLTYGNHALQMAIFYSSSDQLGRDVAVLGFSALAAVSLGIFAMRRGIEH
jgi:ABC-2 type transport system permease protein